MVVIDHARGNQAALRWLLYGGHGNLVRTMTPNYTLSGWQWRVVWGERTEATAGRGYCANLGHPEDETGLVYMRARYYEPLTGRFISEDPSRDGVNWYLYADGNPVNKVDVDGNQPWVDSFLAWFNQVLSPILERAGQLGFGKLLTNILMPVRVFSGNALALQVFDIAANMERFAIMLIRGGAQNIAMGAEWLRFAGAAGSFGQSLVAGYLGIRSIVDGAAELALGVALLSAARVLAGIAYELGV